MTVHRPLAATDDAGHRIYTRRFLSVYDLLVLGFYSAKVWRCAPGLLVDHYERHIRARHLDVGPGTGYFLRHSRLPADIDLTLVDPNPDVLAYARGELAHLDPAVVQADIREPLPSSRLFGSVALNYVLHCLPGPASAKTSAVRNCAAVLQPDGVLFGATVLGDLRLHSRLGEAALRDLNRKGVFCNFGDTEDSVRAGLADWFTDVTVDLIGTVAVFSATGPTPQI